MQCARPSALISCVLALGLWPTLATPGEYDVLRGDIPNEMTNKGALSTAVITAEGALGGRAFEAEIDSDGGFFHFEVATQGAGGVREVSLNAKGDVIADEAEGFLGRLFAEAPDLLELAQSSLAEAITAVEAQIDGFVTSAELTFENGRPIYEVEGMGRDGALLAAVVDAVTGRVTALSVEDR